MTDTPATELKGTTRFRVGALFVLVAVPGVVLFLFSLGRLILPAVAPEYRTAFNIGGASIGLCIGSLAMLVGTGRWGQWLHLAVLLSMPFLFFCTLAIFALLEVQQFVSPLLPATILSVALGFWGARRVDRYYRGEGSK